MRKGRKREGREDGEGVGAAATGFYPPRGLARRASSLVGLPAASGLPRAPRWPGAHAQPGSPPERPAPQRRERARPASGCLAQPGATTRTPRDARAPSACGPAAQFGVVGGHRGAGPRGGPARRGQVTGGWRERRRLVAVLEGGRLGVRAAEGGAGEGRLGGEGGPSRSTQEAGVPGHCSLRATLERSVGERRVLWAAPGCRLLDPGWESRRSSAWVAGWGARKAAGRAPRQRPRIPAH